MPVILIGALIPVVLAIPARASAQTDRSYKVLLRQREQYEGEGDAAGWRGGVPFFWPSWVARRP